MSLYGQTELQKALYAKLTADATLMALITGVYDAVPTNTAFPYIVLGEAAVRDWSSTTTTGGAYSLTFRIFSRDGGKKQVLAIMERVHGLLHMGALSVTGHTSVSMRYESSETRLEDDGITTQGIMRVRVLLQAN